MARQMRSFVRRLPTFTLLAALAAVACSALATAQAPVVLPLADGSVRFAVMGDNGTGQREQYEVAGQMEKTRHVFPFEFVLMLGDNMYGRQRSQDYVKKFEMPYKPLRDVGVTFYAVLGNHDEPSQLAYPEFNMGGRRYYTFTAPRGSVRFFALHYDLALQQEQVAWLRRELPAATEDWKIAFFHAPLYSSGKRHGANAPLRAHLEPLFVEHGVQVAFSGHEHFYERTKPQQGVTYFISGAGGKLRRGNIDRRSPVLAAGFDADRHFMIVEIDGDRLHYQAISRTGQTVDSGVIERGR